MMKLFNRYNLVLVVLLMLVSCTNSDFSDVPNGGSNGEPLVLKLTMPIPSSLTTRGTQEEVVPTNRIVQMPIMLLLEKGKLLEFGLPERVTEHTYNVWMDSDVAKKVDKVIVLTNYGVNEKGEPTFVPNLGDTYKTIVDGYQFTSLVDVKDGLPMWGETDFESNTKMLDVSLKRAVASVDVKLSANIAELFTINKVHISRFYKLGYVGPKAMAEVKSEVETASVAFDVIDNQIVDQIFLSEVDLEHINSDDYPTVVVVEGEYKGRKSFYRIDFLSDDMATEELEYISILRNHKYNFLITEVNAAGWDTLERALNNKLSRALKYKVITLEEGMKEIWELNGQYIAIPETNLTFSPFISKTNPERMICQTNIEGKKIRFTSEKGDFAADITNVPGKDMAYIDFYPLVDDISNIDKVAGRLHTENDVFSFDITLTKVFDFLEIYDIGASLQGKYDYGVKVNQGYEPEHYVDLEIEYKATKYTTLRVRTAGEGKDLGLGFEGVIEFDPNKLRTTARLMAYGAPFGSGKKVYSLDFSKVHKTSPIKKFELIVDILPKTSDGGRPFRNSKILFVTPNGGDYGALFSMCKNTNLIGADGSEIAMYEGMHVEYSSYFPLDSYSDYHIIYYFDNSSLKNGDSNNGNSPEENQFYDAVKQFMKDGGAFIYCSDRRTNGKGYETIDDSTLKDSQTFFDIMMPGWKPTLVRKSIKTDAWLQDENLVKLYNNKGKVFNPVFDFAFQKDEKISNLDILTLPDYSTDPNNMDRMRMDKYFDIVLLSPTWHGRFKSYTYEPVLLYSQRAPFAWMGSHRLFTMSAEENGVLNPSGKAFCNLMMWANMKVNRMPHFNEVNKKKTYSGNKADGFTISYRFN